MSEHRRCGACAHDVLPGSRFCPACGSAVEEPQLSPTRTSLPSAAPGPASAPSVGGRFLPGALLAGRYRIFGLVGRGGMGEVYRADDLKLGQPVALKFLPRDVERDQARLGRLLAEVRIARQISHPNVCRVYDVADADGRHFLSMEYVDGEDLASLLKRIGRLPRDKALQISRQLCAGLAAAHEQGILHRDLKPANVMIDGRGRARITDFGLAGLADEAGAELVGAGTPAYMAPEQLAGKPASVKTDLYSLGLVLYELFTGHAAFSGTTPAELARQHRQESPSLPSAIVEGFDPVAERAILRCLEKDPVDRPASALALASALPGGDPLAAALAAGETPSPELVADAGHKEGLKPAVAVGLFVAILVGTAALVPLVPKVSLVRQIHLGKSPEILADEASRIVQKLGHDLASVDSLGAFEWDWERIQRSTREARSTTDLHKLTSVRPVPVHFWYRQSPRSLVPLSLGGVGYEDPPPDVSGMANLRLDPDGRLLELTVVPPQRDASEGAHGEPPWAELFVAAGLDMASFEPVRPEWNPLVSCNERAAWTGAYAGQPDVPIRVEAGGYRGKPVYFQVVAPWDRPLRMEETPLTGGQKIAASVGFVLFLAVVTGGLLLARRNLRLGRCDRRGAFRLVCAGFAVFTLADAMRMHHVFDWAELFLFLQNTAWTLLLLGFFWVVYIALEPYVRRLWPQALISSSRLLAGRLRDPMIGRDILIGGLIAVGLGLLQCVEQLVPDWIAVTPDRPIAGSLALFDGARQTAAQLVASPVEAMLFPVLLLFLLLLFRVLLRRQWAAVLVLTALWSALEVLQSPNPALSLCFVVPLIALLLFVLIRFGLLAVAAANLFPNLVWGYPLDLSGWYAERSVIVLLVTIGLAGYGFYIALAGRPLFRGGLLPE